MPGSPLRPLVPIGPQSMDPAVAETPPPPPEAGPVHSMIPVDATSATTDQWMSRPDGSPVKIGIGDLPTVLKLGYRPLDPAMAAKLEASNAHKGLLSTLGAAGQGALETLAPVVGPMAENALGYPYEKQRSLKEAHPIAAGVGMVGGAIAPAIATLGASAPASAGVAAAETGIRAGAKFAAPEIIAGIGGKVAAGVEASAGQTALARIAAAAASNATQGAAYVGADWANRAVQGDPSATAEQLFHQGAGAAIFGGGLGVLGGAMSRVAGASATDFVESLREMEARGGLKSTGAIQGLLGKWEKQVGPERLKEIGRFLGREGGVGPFKSFEEMLALAESRFKEPAAKEMDAILQTAHTGKPGSVAFIDEIFHSLYNDGAIKRWAANPLDRAAYGTFSQEMKDLLAQFAVFNEDGTVRYYKQITPDSLHTLSQAFAKKARGYQGSMDPARAAFTEAYDAGRVAVNKRLDQLLEDVSQGQGGLTGEAMKAWKDAKFRYQAGLFLEDGAEQGWKRSMGNNRVSPMEALGMVTGAVTGNAPGAAMVGAGVALARREGSALENMGARRIADFLEKLQTQSGRSIGDSVQRIFEGAAGKSSALVSEAYDAHRVTKENFVENAAHINRLAQDPGYVAEQIATKFGPLIEGGGPVALALQNTVSNAAQHLSSKLPVYQKSGPLDANYVPSPTEISILNRHLVAAHAPQAILDRIADGSFIKEDGEALAAVYPTLLPQMKSQVADALAAKLAAKEPIPRRSQLALSQFLGTDLSSHTNGQTIAAVQAIYQSQSQANAQGGGAGGKPRSLANAKFTSSDQYATSNQSRQSRLEKA